MIAHGAIAVLEQEDSDELLVERARQGDNVAFEDLYRRHTGLAVSVARRMLRSPQDAEDAAAEAFTNVLSALRRQVGPRQAFRPYLLACVRNTCLQRIRRSKQACIRERSLVDINVLDDDKVVEGAVAASAFRSMSPRWQSALWMAEVEHLDPITIAQRLDLSVASAGALIYRARQGFTEAYLEQHMSRSGSPVCAALGPKIAQYVRGTAGPMTSRQVESHVEECQSCAAAVAELTNVNSSLRSLTGPASIVTVAGATAAAASSGGATAGVGGLGLGWVAKAAAIAALSVTPLVVSHEPSVPVPAASHASANVDGGTVRPGTAATPRSKWHVRTSVDAAATSPGPTTHASADADEPIALPPPVGVPAIPVVAPVDDLDATIDTIADEVNGVRSALPIPPLVDLPSPVGLPPITIPPISTPPLSIPPITVPAISTPPISTPVIMVPSITVPALSTPAITVPALIISSLPSLPLIPHLPLIPLGSASQ